MPDDRRPTAAARTILLARHGETEWNRIGRWQGTTDIPLSDVGRQQAEALAERLRDRGITRVHASHLSRALETAAIVAARLGLPPPSADPRLRERGYGAFEGLTREECAERFPGVWERYLADRRAVPPEAEAQADVVARVSAAMHELAAAPDEHGPSRDTGAGGDRGTLLVVSHGGTIRTFIHTVVGVVPPPLENGSVFRLRFDGQHFLSADPE